MSECRCGRTGTDKLIESANGWKQPKRQLFRRGDLMRPTDCTPMPYSSKLMMATSRPRGHVTGSMTCTAFPPLPADRN